MAHMARSVLVVDDDDDFRKLAARTVRSWGCTVVGEAGSVAEAIAASATVRPEAILVDVGLPDGDGFALAERLAALPWRPVVVVISSDADAANGFSADRSGARGFFPKEELTSAPLRELIGGA